MTTRANKQATIKEGIEHVLEELWVLTSEEKPYEMLARDAQNGVDDIIFLSKEELHNLLHKHICFG